MVATKNMSEGKPFKVLLLFALPIIFSVCFQQLYNIADSVIAGQMIGEDALAAVGAAYPITVIFIGIANGLANGSGVIIARVFGNREHKKVKSCVSTIIIFMVVLSLLLTIVAVFCTNPILRLMSTPEDIFVDSANYLNIFIYGLVFLFIYNTAGAIFQALGNSKVPMFMLIFSTVLNVILDIVFIKFCNMGVNGLAWGTFIAQAIASIVSIVVLIVQVGKMSYDGNPEETGKVKLFSFYLLRKCMSIGIPTAIQSSTVSIGQIFIQTLVNGFGSVVIAGYGAGFKVNYIIISIILSISNALATYVSQNVGANKIERLKPGLISGFIMSGVIAIVATLLYVIFPDFIINLFADDSKAVVDVGAMFLIIVAPFYVFVAVKITFDGYIRGAGDIFGYTTSTLIDLIARVGFAYLFVALFRNMDGVFGGEKAIWWSWPVGWVIGALVAATFYFSKRWKKTMKHEI